MVYIDAHGIICEGTPDIGGPATMVECRFCPELIFIPDAAVRAYEATGRTYFPMCQGCAVERFPNTTAEIIGIGECGHHGSVTQMPVPALSEYLTLLRNPGLAEYLETLRAATPEDLGAYLETLRRTPDDFSPPGSPSGW